MSGRPPGFTKETLCPGGMELKVRGLLDKILHGEFELQRLE